MSLDPTQRDAPAIRPPASEVPAWQQASRAGRRPAAAPKPGKASWLVALGSWRLAPLPPQARGAGYLGANWRGELDLARSFWLHHAFIFIPTLLLLSAGLAWLNGFGQGLQLGAIVQLLGWPLLLAFGVWSTVGAWRATRGLLGDSGGLLWGWAARLVLGLSLLQLLVTLALGAAPQVGGWISLARGVDPLGPATIERSDDGLHLQVRGAIAWGDADRLRQMLEAAPALQRLDIVSTGGRLAEGERIAALVRARGLDTRAVGLCADACLPVFLAGAVRQLNPGTQIGLRRLSGGSFNPMAESWLAGQQAQALRGLKLPRGMVDAIFSSPTGRLLTPLPDELQAQGLISPLPQTLEIALPQGREAPLASFVDVLAMHPVWLALEARLPGLSAQLAGRLQAARAAGGSDAELQALAWPLLAPQMPGLIRGVDPILRQRYVQLVLSQLQALRGQGGACRDLLEGRLAVRQSLPLALQVQEAQWLMDAAGVPPDRGLDRATKAIELEVVRRTVGAGAPGLLGGLWEGRAAATDCAAAIGLIERAAAQPPARRDLAERLLFAP